MSMPPHCSDYGPCPSYSLYVSSAARPTFCEKKTERKAQKDRRVAIFGGGEGATLHQGSVVNKGEEKGPETCHQEGQETSNDNYFSNYTSR